MISAASTARTGAVATALVAAALLTGHFPLRGESSVDLPPGPLVVAENAQWPDQGSAATRLDDGPIVARGDKSVPIASLAKVMTAYVVLTRHPLDRPFLLTITSQQVDDTRRRTARGESVIMVAEGEALTERQALEALLLPSANNIAVALAQADTGSVGRFVSDMNERARSLGMTSTTYTDPSGYDPATRSTAQDQVRLFAAAMRLPDFAGIVAERSANLPVAGQVANTNTLLGHTGVVGGKTGSTSAAGGCFVYQAVEVLGGRRVLVTGAVLGQSGRLLVTAGQDAVARLLSSLTRPGAVTAAARLLSSLARPGAVAAATRPLTPTRPVDRDSDS